MHLIFTGWIRQAQCKLQVQKKTIIIILTFKNNWPIPTFYSINPNIRQVVYCSVVASETPGAFDLLWNRFLTTNSAGEQVIILNALGCTKNSTTLTVSTALKYIIKLLLTLTLFQSYLNKIISTEVRLQDKAAGFAATYSQQSENIDTVFNFLLQNHERVSTA